MSIWGNFLIASHSASTVRSRSIFSSVSFPFGPKFYFYTPADYLCVGIVSQYIRIRVGLLSCHIVFSLVAFQGQECLDVSSRAWPLVLPLWPRKATVSRAQPWLSAAFPPSAMLGDCKDSCTHSHLFASELAKVLKKSWKTCWENTGDHLCCLLIKHIFAWQVMQGACDHGQAPGDFQSILIKHDKTPEKTIKYIQILLAVANYQGVTWNGLDGTVVWRLKCPRIPSASIGHPISWTSSKHCWIWVYRHGVRLGSRN